ncbi:MAG: pseudouridine synthase [Chthoniobacterales bacterium]
MRLNRYLAAAGLGSRRSCEALILEGAVRINGKPVTELATQVSPDSIVEVNGRRVQQKQAVYLAFYKPRGVLTTRSDEKGRATIYDSLPPEFENLFYVGRLDRESEGLLLLTNDGNLAQKVAHPSHLIDKEYEVWLDKAFQPEDGKKLVKGFHIPGGRARVTSVYKTGSRRVKVTLQQGIKRQIRLMFYEIGYEVERLRRSRVGGIFLDKMRPGEYRKLTRQEIQRLEKPGKNRTRPGSGSGKTKH